MLNLITIQQAVNNFKKLIEDSITEGGIKAKEAMIRSSKPINNIHEAVKADLIRKGISPNRIHPPLEETKHEFKLAGFIKQKHQDVCVSPEDCAPKKEKMKEGILSGEIDSYGKDYTEKTVSVNIRSQISSLAKNFDTLYERTIAEALNLHTRCPKMVLGEVYMIPVKEYDPKAMCNNQVGFVDKRAAVKKYVRSFQAINGRPDFEKDNYKYERVCLLLVNFQKTPAKIYNTDQELIAEGLLDEDSNANIKELSWGTFTENILFIYEGRFGR